MTSTVEILLIATLISVACALPGNFLVLRKMAMMTDSITHTILLGIVLAFFITHDLNSPFLIIGAALMGVFTVYLTEMLNKTKLLSEDSSIGVIFPLLFSIAIILISKYAGSVHLDTDSVLLGELVFAPFDRLVVFGVDIGASAIYSGAVILIINIVFIVMFYKELKLSCFDGLLAVALGFSPVILHYALMGVVSITAVTAFEAVGSILVIAFMIIPPNTAYLLTDNLKVMIFLSGVFAALSGVLGFFVAYVFDISIAGTMAVMAGVIFFVVFLVAPKRGIVSILLKKERQKEEFAQMNVLLHIKNHQHTEGSEDENGIDTIHHHLCWTAKKSNRVIHTLKSDGKIQIEDGVALLTDYGMEFTTAEYEKIKGGRGKIHN